jgi:hypothetical protein
MVKRHDDFAWPGDLSARAADDAIQSFLHYIYPEGPPERDGEVRRWVAARVWRAHGWAGIVRALQAAAEREAPTAGGSRRSSGSGRRTPTPGTRGARRRCAPRRVTETRWLGGSPYTTRGMHERWRHA